MCALTVPANADESLGVMELAAGCLADMDPTQMPAEALGRYIRVMERIGAIEAVARAKILAAYDAKDGHLADGQRTLRALLVNVLGVTRGQAAEYQALERLVRDHEVLLAGLRESGGALTSSEVLQLARWTRIIPAEYRAKAEEILVAAAQAGANLRALAQIYAEIRSHTAPPDPDGNDPDLDRALFVETTFDGAGLIRGDLTPHCAAMVTAVLDALSAPDGKGDLRTRPQRYHDALAEATASAARLGPAAAAGRAARQGAGAHPLQRAARAGRRLRLAGQVDRRVPGPVGRAAGRRGGQPGGRRRLAGGRRGPGHRLRRDGDPGRRGRY